MLIEYLRFIQILGLLVYSSYPVATKYLFFFVLGFNYANFDFLPNLYYLFATPESSVNFKSYLFASSDMDFLRFMGAIILFFLLWVVILLVAKFLLKINQKSFQWLVRFGLDLIEVKILHSFWSSLIFLIVNGTSSANFVIYVTHACSYFFLTLLIIKRWMIWKAYRSVSLFFLWRIVVTLLVCLAQFGALGISLGVFIAGLGTGVLVMYFQERKSNVFEVTVFLSPHLRQHEYQDVMSRHDGEIKYSFCTTLRKIFLVIIVPITALCFAMLILLQYLDSIPVIVVGTIILLLLLYLLITAILIHLFIEQRNTYFKNHDLKLTLQTEEKINVDQ